MQVSREQRDAPVDACFKRFDLVIFEREKGTATIHIPAVVLAEMIMVAEKQRVAGWTRSEVELLVDAVSDASKYVLTELTPMLVLRPAEFPIVPDIFHRLIATEVISQRRNAHQSRSGFCVVRHGRQGKMQPELASGRHEHPSWRKRSRCRSRSASTWLSS